MIDVVFLLLIFFLATSSFQKLEKMLPSAVAAAPDQKPQGSGSDPQLDSPTTDLSDVVVEIQLPLGQGMSQTVRYVVNSEPIDSYQTLEARLKAILKVRLDVPIVIDPADRIPSGEAIRIYDMVRLNGATAVFLVAR
jgi:biopolymer transport protein ExbD